MAERIRVEIDRASLLELARGGNLYQGPFACIRELLSNAADATLLRLFEERGAEAFPTHERCIADLRTALADRPIDVTLEPIGDLETGAIRVGIRDHGTGISRDDLAFLGTLGASHRNPRRRATVEAMPEWMRPTGAFGIGLHSVFLVADSLQLRTTHAATGASCAIRLFRDDDGVSIEVSEDEPLEAGGTEATLEIPRSVMSAVLHHGGNDEVHLLERRDFVLDPLPDIPLLDAGALVRDAAAASVVPVRHDGRELPRTFAARGTVFDPESGLEIGWPEEPAGVAPMWRSSGHGPRFHRHDLFFRGAAVEGTRDDRRLPALRVNVHFGTAREMLDLAREALSDRGGQRVAAATRAAFLCVAPRWIDATDPIALPEPLRAPMSLALWRNDGRAGLAWRNVVVAHASDQTPVSLARIASHDEIRVEVSGDEVRARVLTTTLEAPIDDDWTARQDLRRLFPDELVEVWEASAHHGFASRNVRRFGKDGRRGAAATAFHAQLASAVRTGAQPRVELTPHESFVVLTVDRARLSSRVHRFADWQPDDERVLVPPYVVRDGCIRAPEITRWVRFVVEHAPEPRDVRDVARATWRFLVEHDPVVRAIPDVTVDVDLEALRRELETLGVDLSA